MLNTRCGSESFAAPEIIMAKSYDGRDTDSWAVGVVLYALIVGEMPFDGEDGERRRKMMRIAKAQYSFPTDVGSIAVRNVISKLLVRDPAKRTRVGDIWDEPWMSGPGAVERPTRGSKEERLEGGRKKVLDGFLVDGEDINQVALAEEA
jgi:tRNA (cytidine32/guanosine34-2'-O)-methyltransferase